MSILEITKDNFEAEVMRAAQPVLLDFWAEWCPQCKELAPILEEIAVEKAGQVKVGKVNVAEQPELAERHRIVSLPALVLYKNGAIAQKQIGGAPRSEIEAMLV
jgi:thioredoxin 1